MEANEAPNEDASKSESEKMENDIENPERSSTDDSSNSGNGYLSDGMMVDGNSDGRLLDPVTGYLEPAVRRPGGTGTRGRSVSEGSSSSEEDSTSGARKDDKRQKMNIPSGQGFMIPGVSASPPQFVSLEQIMKAANAVSRMALAHEIAINKDFKLEKVDLPENSFQKKVKDTVHQAFWDLLHSQLEEDPPNYTHAIVLLKEIKEGLVSLLLPHHTKLHQEIYEVLDVDLILQQTEKGVLDFNYYAQYIISVMSKLCAPVRDEQIRDLMREGDVVPVFRGILQTIELMKLDMANFHIRLIRPHLQQQSIEYERAKFAEYLELHDDGLICTRGWLRRNAEKLASVRPASDVVGTAAPEAEAWPSAARILTASYMELLQWDKNNDFPETLLLDQSRFLDLGARVEFITLAAAVMLVTYSTVGAAINGISVFKEQLKSHLNTLLEGCEKLGNLNDLMKNVAVQVLKEVDECLLKHGYAAMGAEKGSVLQGQIEEVADVQHRVRHLVKTRILEFVESVLVSSTASPIRIPPGLSSMQMELSRLTGQFLRLVSHNRAVFGDHYADIITTIRKGTPPSVPAPLPPAESVSVGQLESN